MLFSKIEEIHIKARFTFYPNIVANDKKELWQLPHVKNKRTRPYKKIIFNKDRNAYRIESQWVSRKRLINYMIKTNETIPIY